MYKIKFDLTDVKKWESLPSGDHTLRIESVADKHFTGIVNTTFYKNPEKLLKPTIDIANGTISAVDRSGNATSFNIYIDDEYSRFMNINSG